MVMREGQMDGFNGADFNTIQGAFPNAIAHSMAGELPDPWWTEPLETAEDVVTRLEPFIIRLLENDEDAAVVGHGASVNGTLTVLLRRFEPTRVDLNRGNWNAALSSFRISPRYECLRLNDIAHLSDDMVTSNAEHPDSEAIQKARA
jgi:broad specificity phosphatase PhoE